VAFAFASCQRWDEGYYSAYRRLAEEDLAFVVHLGDYFYEYGIDEHGGFRSVPVPDQFRPECETLERYRLQHRLYKSDPDLQSAHQLFPWIITWDDHEVQNDYAGLAPEGWLSPAALPRSGQVRLFRRVGWGDLAEFSVLDARQYRTDQPCGDGEFPRCPESLDPAVTMLGSEQEAWLLDGLARSRSRWNVIAQQVMMGQLDHNRGDPRIYWHDAWDGYPAARQRIIDHLAAARVRNPVVITGDWHSTFVNDIKKDFSNSDSATVATEFVGTSISSNGDGIIYGPYYGPMIPANPHIKFFDGDRRGYVRCLVDRDQWRSDLRMVSTVSRSDAPVSTFVVRCGERQTRTPDGLRPYPGRPFAARYLPSSTPSTASRPGSNDGSRPLQISVIAKYTLRPVRLSVCFATTFLRTGSWASANSAWITSRALSGCEVCLARSPQVTA
jgi:alkaline phosphatase D